MLRASKFPGPICHSRVETSRKLDRNLPVCFNESLRLVHISNVIGDLIFLGHFGFSSVTSRGADGCSTYPALIRASECASAHKRALWDSSGFRSRLNIARMAHRRADAAQTVLSVVKIFVALLPDHTGSVHPVTRESLTPGHFAGFVRPGPTVRPASLPPAGQAGRRQFGSDRGRRQRWKLETLQGLSTFGAGHGT